MKLHVRLIKLRAGKPIAFMHNHDAQKLAVHSGDRVTILDGGKNRAAIVDTASGLFHEGEIALSEELAEELGVRSKSLIEVVPATLPKSSRILQTKKWSREYTKDELKTIMRDLVNDTLSDAEIAYFVSGVYHHGLSLKETLYLTQAIFETGSHLTWNSKAVADKHSIGGIPGNRTTPVIVAICAAVGITMPKTSSRAITSAAGTADVIESIAHVDFSIKELKKIVEKTNACLAWGGSLGLAPADDKLIQIEKRLNLDPEPQLIASILSKKLAVGSTHVLIDIPYGPGAKVSKSQALKLKGKFLKLGRQLKLTLKVVLTDGSQPIGNGIGPALEIKDVLSVLRHNDFPIDLEKKSVMLSGVVLEMLGKAKKGKGRKLAQDILNSGQALAKFKEIIEAQGGKIDGLPEAAYSRVIASHKDGIIQHIDNKKINSLARTLGSPLNKKAGLYLHKHVGESIKKGRPLLTLYAESEDKLKEALVYVKETPPIRVE